MTDRSFTAEDLVTLPNLSAPAAIALGTEVLAACKKAGQLPAAIAHAHKSLAHRHEALRAAVSASPEASAEDPAEARDADARIDSCWASLLSPLLAACPTSQAKAKTTAESMPPLLPRIAFVNPILLK